jgi:formylglycine-generating enzyme required for sulfatase activity
VIGRGLRVAQSIAVPPATAMPGFVYVPAGEFLYGSGREEGERRNLLAQPLHRVHSRAFWISRTEVTYAQWIEYLRALPPAERSQRLPSGIGVAFEESPDGRFTLTLEPSPDEKHRARQGEPLIYPGRTVRREVHWEHLPVSGVSYLDAVAYTAWLDRTGRVSGARVCTAREWEHAARGVDGRWFPHGNVLQPSDANIDETYERTPSAFGPDEVGSFPASNSPYDVADLAGNVWELTTVGDKPWYKGGCFYHTAFAALSENRGNPADAKLANVKIGLRVCADAAR